MVNNRLAKLLRRMCDTQSPVGLLIMMAVSIFVLETLVMVVIHIMPFHDKWEGIKEALLDASFLVALLSPFFYYFFFRPLLRTIEERRRTEEALRTERDRLETVTENIGAGLAIISRDYRTLWSNSIIRNMFGDVAGKPCYSAYNRQHAVCNNCGAREVFEKGKDKVVSEHKGSDVDGRTIWSQIIATPIRDEGGNVTAALELVVPITERKLAEEALQVERNKLKGILDAMNDGVYIINQNFGIEYINPVIGRAFGPSEGRKCYGYFHDRTEICPWCRNNEVFAGKSVRWEWHSSKTGRIYDLFDTPLRNADGSVSKLEIFHDVTERKKAEDALRESGKQLSYLSSQILTAQESERSRISRELHDELGPSLASLKLRLRAIENSLLPGQRELKDECEEYLWYMDYVIESVRRISRDLSPYLLEELGLTSSLKRMLDALARSHGIKASLDVAEIDQLFSPKEQVLIYRIFQEALTNVGKYAQAPRVSISIKQENGGVSFSVEDNGKGFDANEVGTQNPADRGMGLAIMKQRAQMLGGSFTVWSEKEKGTKIMFAVPLGGKREEGDHVPL